MKALTLHQPWASLVAEGIKTIETRSWNTKYRGPLAIHAAKQKPVAVGAYSIFEWSGGGFTAAEGHEERSHLLGIPLSLGAVVATCTLVDVVPIVDRSNGLLREIVNAERFVATFARMSRPVALVLVRKGDTPVWTDIEDQRPYGDFRPGRFAWLLDDIVKAPEPIPARGRQQLWEWAP